MGLLGPGDPERHVEHALAMVGCLREAPRRLLDLGSGGGMPGLVLALRWPEARCTLLDSSSRSRRFLEWAIGALGITGRVEAREERAEVAGRQPDLRERFGLVVARSFGPPAVTAECAAGFLARGGRLVVSEPPAPEEGADTGEESALSPRWPVEGLEVLGLGPPRRCRSEGFSFAVMEKTTALEERWPRRSGVPAKRPLWRA